MANPRRKHRVGLILVLALILSISLLACGQGALLTQASLSGETLSPNGDGVDDWVDIDYQLSREATLTVSLVDGQGNEYLLRRQVPRAAGSYQARFDGTYAPDPDHIDRRVVSSGRYRVKVVAEDSQGHGEARELAVNIIGADTAPPFVKDVACLPCAISPNGDARDDEAIVSYRVTKESAVTLFITDAKGEKNILEAANPKRAALYSHRWNGTAAGDLLPDGAYTIHIQAQDKAGNITEATTTLTLESGGSPRLEIVEVRFWPPSVPVEGVLNVEIRAKNTGTSTLRTMGPPPGTAYTTDMNFNSFRRSDDPGAPPLYFEQAGYWRVGVDFSTSGRPFPLRWGLGRDLAPGEEAVITGTVQVLVRETREVNFWAGVIQEGVGFPGGQVGLRRIIVSY